MMRLVRQRASKAAKAFPVSGVQGISRNPVISGQGLLGHGRAQLKKLVRVRVGTLNVDDWKRKGIGGSDGEEEGWNAVCAGDEMEGSQGEIVGRRLLVAT